MNMIIATQHPFGLNSFCRGADTKGYFCKKQMNGKFAIQIFILVRSINLRVAMSMQMSNVKFARKKFIPQHRLVDL